MIDYNADAIDLFATCAGGTEKALRFELRDLGVTHTTWQPGGASFTAPLSMIATVNVFSRIANKVLWRLDVGPAATEDELIERLAALNFSPLFDKKTTFAVHAHLRNVPWTHSRYAAQRVKDVIVDQMRDLGRPRPNVDVRRPDLRFVLHWADGTATLSLDTSGASLHRRGYRHKDAKAPLRESFAAAILATGHADIRRPFLDPCCGSGTLAIEQAWRALDRAPGIYRGFAFERWPGLPATLRDALRDARDDARARIKDQLDVPILLSDHNPNAVAQAVVSVQRAGLAEHLRVQQLDARDGLPEGDNPVICTNLPYGERMGGRGLQLEGFYRTLGEHFATIAGARILLLTQHQRLHNIVSLGRCKRWSLRNGPIDVTLYRWDR